MRTRHNFFLYVLTCLVTLPFT